MCYANTIILFDNSNNQIDGYIDLCRHLLGFFGSFAFRFDINFAGKAVATLDCTYIKLYRIRLNLFVS